MSYVIDEVCYLGIVDKSKKDSRGHIQPEIVFDEHKTWCFSQSVRMTEAYQALAVGMRPEIVLVLRQEDYNGQNRVLYGGIVYKVLRTYRTGKSEIELVLYREEHPDES